MQRTFIPCHSSNYTPGRTKAVDRIVIHYTGNDGDTAENNGVYFSGAGRKASAHWFVDEHGLCASVPEGDTAWHAGNWDMNCRSLGVELCSVRDAAGKYRFPAATVKNAAALVRELMERYGIPASGVIRHYDVTGKKCPAPMVDDPALWQAFLSEITRADVPDSGAAGASPWAREDCVWAVSRGLFRGDEHGDFHWQQPMTREQTAAVLHRLYRNS